MIHCIKSATALRSSLRIDRAHCLLRGAAPAALLSLIVGSLLAAAPASAQFINPLSTNVSIEATAANTDGHTGIARNTFASDPLRDSASDVYGLDRAESSASVDAAGLRASTVVRGDPRTGDYAASSTSFAALVDPFILIPQAGFSGTQALLRIPFTFAGSIDLLPTFDSCASCFGRVEARIGVDGMTELFSFSGVSSHGTVGSGEFIAGPVARSGVLEGLVPVNTELYLRASLFAQAFCQPDTYTGMSCGADSIFDTLAFTASSPDAVGFVWGLAPVAVAPVPEPSTLFLFASGVMAVCERRRQISLRARG